MLLRCAKQPADTHEQRPIGCANRQSNTAGPPGCQFGKRRGIRRRLSADLHRDVVATVPTRLTNPRRHPPDRRMKEQQRLPNRLQQVDGIVAAADMGQLVREKRLDLAGRQAAEGSDWQQDQRAHEPDDTRRIDERRFHDPERDRQPQPPGNPLARRLPRRCGLRAGCGSQPVHAPRAAGKSCQQEGNARRPGPDHIRKPRFERSAQVRCAIRGWLGATRRLPLDRRQYSPSPSERHGFQPGA